MTSLVLASLTPLLLILVAYLFLRLSRCDHDPLQEGQRLGHGIDIHGVAERVGQVRHDYLSQLHPRHLAATKRRGLVACARSKVGRLSYFQKPPARPVAHSPDQINAV